MHNKSIQFLKGIGPKKAAILKSDAGIITIEDLLYYRPRRYIDRSSFKLIQDCFVNDVVTIFGVIRRVVRSGKRRRFLEVEIDDGSDTISGIFFGGIQYFERIFKPGDHVLFSGKIDFYRKKQIVHPDFDFVDHEYTITSIHTGRIVPLYPSTEKLKQSGFDSRGFRRILRIALEFYLDSIEDPFDSAFLERLNLIPLRDAIASMHFPETLEETEKARRRLAFNELFFMQYYLCISKRHVQEEHRTEMAECSSKLFDEFLSRIPFQLTADQKIAIDEIRRDLENPYPMNRLLQGDVGSGKTVVAIAASLLVNGRSEQVALMAPTEVLASQHYETCSELCPPGVKVQLLTGSISKAEKESLYRRIAEGEINIIIGTHALIQEPVRFHTLGLVIIDEQHRFGVKQRATLRGKGHSPDLLIMTATPIPRSLSLTIYGDLDISYIKTKPQNRLPIKTLAFTESRRTGIYNSVEKYVSEGRQVYYILPLIEESEKSDLRSAIQTYHHLQDTVFPHLRVALLHGKMPAEEKDAIMKRFKERDIDILVATTVVEVGIDVPNASVIIIEHPERFGLSQLHQLRGRIGRGEHQSFCILIYSDSISGESKQRIEIMTRTDDGFVIAEEDLRFRGAGEIMGEKQHGHTGLEFTDLTSDLNLIMTAREEAVSSVNAMESIDTIIEDLQDSEKASGILQGIRKKRILSILS